MTILADITTLWFDYVWPIFLLVFGFGMVVFIHELGHFLAAKSVGVRVDRFALGFGPRLFGIKRGETDYCVNLLPLGGYVKMLGQEDAAPIEEGGEATKDPRSFLNKPIWARMVIVSAGVVMNLIFAAVLFVVVCMAGISFTAPIVGGTVEGYPAAEVVTSFGTPASQPTTAPAAVGDRKVGLKPGDKILSVGGKDTPIFDKIGLTAALADRGERFLTVFERDGKTGTCELTVKMGPQGRLIFGIEPPRSLVVGLPVEERIETDFVPGDRVTAVDGRPIENHWDIEPVRKALTGKTVTVTVQRNGETVDIPVVPLPRLSGPRILFRKPTGEPIHYKTAVWSEEGTSIEVTLLDGTTETLAAEAADVGSANILDVYGLIPRLTVAGVTEGSRADEAGLEPGDIIIDYADKTTPTLLKLREMNEHFAGKGTNITVIRDGKTLEPMRVVPKDRNGHFQIGIMPGVDVIHPVVGAVRTGSLAAKAGLIRGDVITAINDVKVTGWNDIVAQRLACTGGQVAIAYTRGQISGRTVIPDAGQAVFTPSDYRFDLFRGRAGFEMLMGPEVKTSNPLTAIVWGLRQTRDMLVMNYATIRSLANRTVSPGEVRGPVGIFEMGIQIGRRGLVKMIYFLAMISVCLAVFNFLPLPLVDGGLAVILIIEKIRGRPLSVKVMNIIQMAGLVMILGIFVAVTWNDITRIIDNMW